MAIVVLVVPTKKNIHMRRAIHTLKRSLAAVPAVVRRRKQSVPKRKTVQSLAALGKRTVPKRSLAV